MRTGALLMWIVVISMAVIALAAGTCGAGGRQPADGHEGRRMTLAAASSPWPATFGPLDRARRTRAEPPRPDEISVRPYEAPAEQMELRLLAAPAAATFLTRMAQQYNIMRPEMSIVVAHAETSEKAIEALERGEADMALSSLIPTPADLARAPDIFHLPMWAYAYTPITNVPALGALPVLLSLPLVCRIFSGTITHWNDSALVSLNPQLSGVTAPIEVVLVGDDLSYILDFTQTCGWTDAAFAALIPTASMPAWPRHLYARSTVVHGVTGPTSYVVDTPHTVALVLSSFARKLEANIASMVNRDGEIVRPSFATVDSAVRARAVITNRDSQGRLSYAYSSALSNAPGKGSWPLNGEAMMAIPQSYVRTTCRSQAELVKFVRWALDDDSVRYSIGRQEDAVLMPDEVDHHLGIRKALDGIACGVDAITVDDAFAVVSGGGNVATMHTRARDVLALHYRQWDPSHVTVRNVVQDPATALDDIRDPRKALDVAFFFPQAYKLLYPGSLEQHVAKGRIRFMPFAAYGVIPSYSFSTATRAALATADALPLKLDMETLGGIFTGAIRSWTDPVLVGFNPALGSVFAGGSAAAESAITLVLYGSGDRNNVAQSALSNALVLALSKTRAVLDSGLSWSLPADWQPVTARLDALGVRFVMVRSETDLEATVARIPGAIGYKLSIGNASNPETDFAIVRYVQPALEAAADATAADLQPFNVTVLGVPDSFGACASAAKPTSGGELDLQTVGWSAAPSAAGCWPITLTVTIALPADIGTVVGGVGARSENMERLCASKLRVARYSEYLLFHALESVDTMTGFAPLATVPWIREVARRELNGVFCGGKPLMYTPAVVWELSSAVRTFAVVTSCVFAVLAIIAAVLIVKFRARTIIRSGDLPLQLAMLTGLVMLLICPILFVAAPDAAVCRLLGYLLCLGFSLAFGPIAAKIWRVHATFKQRRSLKVHRISTRTLYAIVGTLLVVDAVLLASQNSKGALLAPATVSKFESSRVHEYAQCTTSAGALPIAGTLLGIKAALLLVTALLAFGVRHVSSAFGESANLSWAVWNTVLSSALLVAILALVGGGTGDVHTFLLVFLLLWIAASTLIFSFGYKLAALLSEEWRSATEASRLSRTSRTSKQTSNTSGAGTGTGTFGSGSANSAFQMPSLGGVPLFVLERYMIALETQLRLAKEQRRVEFGAAYVAAKSSGLGTSTGAPSYWSEPQEKRAITSWHVPDECKEAQQQVAHMLDQPQVQLVPSPKHEIDSAIPPRMRNSRLAVHVSQPPVHDRHHSLDVPTVSAGSPHSAGASPTSGDERRQKMLSWHRSASPDPGMARQAVYSNRSSGGSGRVSPQPLAGGLPRSPLRINSTHPRHFSPAPAHPQ